MLSRIPSEMSLRVDHSWLHYNKFTVLILIKPVVTISIGVVLILFFILVSLINRKKILKNSETISKSQNKIVDKLVQTPRSLY